MKRILDESPYFEVFARHEDGEPIRHIGSVRAASSKDAGVFAVTLYDEFKWKAMFVVPRSDLNSIVRPA